MTGMDRKTPTAEKVRSTPTEEPKPLQALSATACSQALVSCSSRSSTSDLQGRSTVDTVKPSSRQRLLLPIPGSMNAAVTATIPATASHTRAPRVVSAGAPATGSACVRRAVVVLTASSSLGVRSAG